MNNIEKFFTKEQADKGVKIELTYPDGSKSDEWLMMRGTDSSAFKLANHQVRIELIDLMEEENKEIVFTRTQEANIKLLSSLVADWSFDMELTEKNVINFLTQAPQIADKIDTLSTNRSLFTKSESTNSLEQLGKDSHLAKPPKGQVKRNVKRLPKSGKPQVSNQKS